MFHKSHQKIEKTILPYAWTAMISAIIYLPLQCHVIMNGDELTHKNVYVVILCLLVATIVFCYYIMHKGMSNFYYLSNTPREEYLLALRGKFANPPLETYEKVLGKNCYEFNFTHNGRKYKFIDHMKLIIYRYNRKRVIQGPIVLSTQLDDNFTLLFQREQGNTPIGTLAESLFDDYEKNQCGPLLELDSKDLDACFHNVRPLTNQEERTIKFLTNAEVLDVFYSIWKDKSCPVPCIKNGSLQMDFQNTQQIKDNPDLIDDYIDIFEKLLKYL